MRRCLKLALWFGVLLGAGSSPALEFHASPQLRDVAVLVGDGHFDEAAEAARRHLAADDLLPSDRLALLRLLADTAWLKAKARHFSDVDEAVRAHEALLGEFPDHPKAGEWRWRIARLWWRHGDMKQALVVCRTILARDETPAARRRTWLLMARIHLALGQLAKAREALIQHGLLAEDGSRDQAEGEAWMAVVDMRESRPGAAWQALSRIAQRWPDVLAKNLEAEAVYIELLRAHGKIAQARLRAERFVASHPDAPQSPRVRLLLADLMAARPETRQQAIAEYEKLAQSEAETALGYRAFMRALMLRMQQNAPEADLRGAIEALQRIADRNQLSPVEDEALLDIGLLHRRLEQDRLAEETASQALDALMHAASSHDARLAAEAKRIGRAFLSEKIQAQLKAGRWTAAVATWRRYALLRPKASDDPDLYLGMARAHRMLGMYDAAQPLLDALLAMDPTGLRGQRVMIEQARLWLDAGVADAPEKLARWLNEHPYTIYAPELGVILARMHLASGQVEQARRRILSIRPGDLAPGLRAEYWRTRAEVAERLGNWAVAAERWRAYAKAPKANKTLAASRRARALVEAQDWKAAIPALLAVPEEARDSAWQYRMGLCELHSGETAKGEARLRKLIEQADGSGDAWATLARLALAERDARLLLAERQ